MSPRTRLLVSLGSVLVVLAIGTAGYIAIEQRGLLESFYMTVITVFTVGYKETFELSSAGRVWTIVVIMVGYGTVAISLANLVSLAVGGELRALRGRLRMNAEISQLAQHVVICGYGRMGSMVAAELRAEKAPFVVVDKHVYKEMSDGGVLYVQGDATEEAVLQEAGLMRASSLVAALGSDADNVYVTLTARGLRPDLRIIARAEQRTTETKLKRAGADSVICPHVIGATKTVSILMRPHVVDFVDMAVRGVNMEIAQFEVPAGSPLVGARLRDSRIRERVGVIVAAIKRVDGSQIFGPGPDEVIREADQLILLGREGSAERLSMVP